MDNCFLSALRAFQADVDRHLLADAEWNFYDNIRGPARLCQNVGEDEDYYPSGGDMQFVHIVLNELPKCM